MKTTVKYLFDDDFAAGEKPTITLVEHERRRTDAESQAYRNGFSAGQAQANSETAQQAANSLALIVDGLDKLNRTLNAIEARLEVEAVEVAVAVAGKLAPELIARQPFDEISALATECFRHLVTTPHVVVRIGPDIYDTASHKLEEIAAARGFEGRLVVHPEAGMAPGDCRIEWSEGGVVRDRATAASIIEEVVARYVDARTAGT